MPIIGHRALGVLATQPPKPWHLSCYTCLTFLINLQVRVIIVRTSVPAFNAYGGCCPPRRSIAPKMSPVRRKIPLGAPKAAFGTDGDIPVSLTCSATPVAAPRDRDERVPSINRG